MFTKKRRFLLTALCHHNDDFFYRRARKPHYFFRFINGRFEQVLTCFSLVLDDFLRFFYRFYTKIVWNLFPGSSFFDEIKSFSVHGV
jgi:hypothetical protein